MNPDGTNAEIIGYNYRNSYEQSVTSLGDVFQNDNDDPPACRVSWVMEYANFGFSSNDGQRTLAGGSPARARRCRWRSGGRTIPGMTPAGDVYGGGSPTGNVFYENGALGAGVGRHVLRRRRRAQRGVLVPAGAPGRGLRARPQDLPDLEREAAVCRLRLRRRQRHARRARSRRCSGRPTSRSVPTARSTSATGSTRASAATRISTTATSGAIYRIAPKGFVSKVAGVRRRRRSTA